jgi:ureidoacrylate peracid hydrolase
MTIDLGRPALIVVDVQNDFVHPNGKVGRGGSDMQPLLDAVDAINRLIRSARMSRVPVVYVRVTHSPAVDNAAYRARYALRGMAADDLLCADGAWGAEFYPALRGPEPSELVVTKHAYDGFAVADLSAHLANLGVDTAIVTGVVTELCVMGTAAGGFEHGFHIVVPQEATGSVDPLAAEAALNLVRRFYGRVATADEVAAAMESLRAVEDAKPIA